MNMNSEQLSNLHATAYLNICANIRLRSVIIFLIAGPKSQILTTHKFLLLLTASCLVAACSGREKIAHASDRLDIVAHVAQLPPQPMHICFDCLWRDFFIER